MKRSLIICLLAMSCGSPEISNEGNGDGGKTSGAPGGAQINLDETKMAESGMKGLTGMAGALGGAFGGINVGN